MAEEWNKCSNLASDESFKEAIEKYNELTEKGLEPFEYMLQMQTDLQKALYAKLPNQALNVDDLDTNNKKYIWLRNNKIAADDEFSELVDALPGMSAMDAKNRTSLWKTWKSNHLEVRSMRFSNLSDEDKKEAFFENSDISHFILNMVIAGNLHISDVLDHYGFVSIEGFFAEFDRDNELDLDVLGNKYDYIRDAHQNMSKMFYDMMLFDGYTIEINQDMLEINLIDIFREYLKVCYAMGMGKEEMFCYYYLKNAENHRRSQSGY